jgi:hypothetical protein
MTLSQTQATVGALADNDPTETVVVSLQPPPKPPHHDGGGSGRISQTTEHLLIAAGSIGRFDVFSNTLWLLTTTRCYNHHRDDCAGFLHNAQARTFLLRRCQTRQEPSHAPRRGLWQVRLGQQEGP